ncbi:hypothetical protein Gogos_020918 [Gossypium gossypioides]|uniref:Uncharacterized protein n=1 Tax=Gossypium gossypioides TaxID=34282 RepID=A0A7J9D2D0_GOSGO|nr:hypothetical protein [Gossypium gossypioides]
MIFSRVLGYIDETVTDLFDRLDKRVTPVPAILAETFRSLSACRSTENYSLLKELAATPRRDKITVKKWMTILQNLKDENRLRLGLFTRDMRSCLLCAVVEVTNA